MRENLYKRLAHFEFRANEQRQGRTVAVDGACGILRVENGLQSHSAAFASLLAVPRSLLMKLLSDGH
jgi:hypothetical protein